MNPRFIDVEIEVEVGGELAQPTSFRWSGTEYVISEVLHQWSDWGFAAGAHQRSWRTRRHRNYYRVETSGGERWEIYLDRQTPQGTPRWFLYQQVE